MGGTGQTQYLGGPSYGGESTLPYKEGRPAVMPSTGATTGWWQGDAGSGGPADPTTSPGDWWQQQMDEWQQQQAAAQTPASAPPPVPAAIDPTVAAPDASNGGAANAPGAAVMGQGTMQPPAQFVNPFAGWGTPQPPAQSILGQYRQMFAVNG